VADVFVTGVNKGFSAPQANSLHAEVVLQLRLKRFITVGRPFTLLLFIMLFRFSTPTSHIPRTSFLALPMWLHQLIFTNSFELHQKSFQHLHILQDKSNFVIYLTKCILGFFGCFFIKIILRRWEYKWTIMGKGTILSHTTRPHPQPHSHTHVRSLLHCVSLSKDHSGRKDCYVNAPVNRIEWTALKQIMLNCLLV